MIFYEVQDLKQQFKEFERLQNLTLVPLFDRIANSFYRDLKENPSKYDISDGRMAEDGEYIMVVNGKLVSFRNYHISIDDAGAGYNKLGMVDRMGFGCNEKGAMKIYQGAKNFVKNRNLDDLLKEAKQKLGFKPNNLSPEMGSFYFCS